MFFSCLIFVAFFTNFGISQNPTLATQNINIGAIVSEANDIQVLQLALVDILANNAVHPDLHFQFIFRIGCPSGMGLDHAASLHFLENVTALIGPHCSEEISSLTKLASRWKLPVVSYAQIANIDVQESTLARVAPSTPDSMNDCIQALGNFFSWDKIAIIYNASDDDISTRSLNLIRSFSNKCITTISYEIIDRNMSLTAFRSVVDVETIRLQTRVIIVLMGSQLGANQEALQLLNRVGIAAPEFVILLPWINHDPDQYYPWITVADNKSVVINRELKKTFVGAYVVDADRQMSPTGRRFFSTLEQYNLTSNYDGASYDLALLYDCLKLYVLAVNGSYTQFGPDGILDPTKVVDEFAGLEFEGASGQVEIDLADSRIPYYGVYLISDDNSYDLRQVASVNPKKYTCDATGKCYRLNVTSFEETIQADIANRTREPACGFTSAECDYSKWYIIAAAVSAIIIVALLAFYCKKQGFKFFGNSNKTMAQISWMIPLEKVEMIKDERPADKSESDISSAWSYFHPPDGETAIVFNNIVKIRRFKQLKTINFDATEAKFLLSLKSLIHDNINPMIGMCFNNPTNELLVLSKFCPRGTLSDYLHNPEMRMDGRFKTAFLRDIINGLDYLHNAPIGFHGNLTTSNCVIDANFIVKLVSVGMDDILEDWKSNGWIAESGDEQPRRPLAIEILEEDLLYRAPEFLRKSAPPRPKLIRMGKSEQIRIKQQCRMGDIYSLGIIFFEVLFRQHPFTDFEGTVEDLINKLRFPSRQVVRPVVPKVLTKDHHPAMMQLMQSCWSEDAISRPGIKRVKKLFSTIYRVRGGLVDSIIQIMDQHANSLEKQVRERTRLLEEAQLRADRLLAQMIPKDVARDLKLGRPVIPRNFEHSSVLFTDIVGFTTICGQSTPMEIVNFLNDLFTGYDAIISQSDAYKVETIGDAYMVVSGVPNENGTENVKIIATIALKMRQYLAGYKLPHIPDRKMRARWGLHTGPVAAGVVGLIAPRYCLFGDTVNMASRMESTGEPEKIQTSSNFYESIQSRGDLFIMEKRGIIPVKGKGDCTTYWLIDYAATQDEN